MSNWGLSETGYSAKTYNVIRTEIENDIQQQTNSKLRFDANNPLGILIPIISLKLRERWEAEQALYNANDPDLASGQSLVALSSLTGSEKYAASKSHVMAKVKLEPNASLPKGSVASVKGNPKARFSSLADIKNINRETAWFDIKMEATEYGSIAAPKSCLTNIETPLTGWLSIINERDANLGRLEETNDEFRLRRIRELRAIGTSTKPALEAKLLSLKDVRSVEIINNDSSSERFGLKNNSFECIVLGGDNQEIATEIAQNRPIGISAQGKIELNGARFSRPDAIELSIQLKVKTSSSLTDTEKDEIKNKILEYTSRKLLLGEQVYSTRLYQPVFSNDKIMNIESLLIHKDGKQFTDIITDRQYASFAPERIDIEVVHG